MQTPGTNGQWTDLAEWIRAARLLDKRRASAKRNRDLDSHWKALPIAFVEQAQEPELTELISMLRAPNNVPWGAPHRGQRRLTKWDDCNCRARNRLWRLARAADLATIGIGHNSAAMSETTNH